MHIRIVIPEKSLGICVMILLIFFCMLMALSSAWLHYPRLAVISWSTSFLLAAGWFVFHVYNKEAGFRLPWLQF